MGRPPDGSQVRDTTVHVRFTSKGAAYLDAAAGKEGRSSYIRRLVSEDVARRRVRPKETR